jgi:hypothetical protein
VTERSQLIASDVAPLIRFGKPSGAWFEMKDFFFTQDADLVAQSDRVADIYLKQPRRMLCKICRASLGQADFVKQRVPYAFCDRCGHLNGLHEDTDAFCRAIYIGEESKVYETSYRVRERDKFFSRMRDIYSPKAEFLIDGLAHNGAQIPALRLADYGAGSGYFVAAAREAGFRDAIGYEASQVQLAQAEAMLGPGFVRPIDMGALVEHVRTVEAEVLTFIFVVEHLQNPIEVFRVIASNPHVHWLFFSVPLHSISIFLEAVFPQHYHRQLSAGHTHLFCESSIDWLCRETGFRRAAEWWFGADMIDLFRLMAVDLQRRETTRGMERRWDRLFRPLIDDLQLGIDRRKLSSEVHILLENRAP